MEKSLGVTKGKWTENEDALLRKCIQKFGVGKWHLVPLRAGLNRCRKSCRLRWLNYLTPDINRGEFKDDEVDLMIKLHKLLGNRWSLIAGRLPGRTANDVKNYWNTHIRKKVFALQKQKELKNKNTDIIIGRPQPRRLTKNVKLLCSRGKTAITDKIGAENNFNKPSASNPPPQENEDMWWENLFLGTDCDRKRGSAERDFVPNLRIEENQTLTNVWDTCFNEGNIYTHENEAILNVEGPSFANKGKSCWSDDDYFNGDMFQSFNEEHQTFCNL